MSSAAERNRLKRERRNNGLRCARVVYDQVAVTERLIADEFLARGTEDNARAVEAALERMIAAYAQQDDDPSYA